MPKTVALLAPVLAAAALPLALSLSAGTAATSAGQILCEQPNPKLPGACVGEYYIEPHYGTFLARQCKPGTKPSPTDELCTLPE
jgi:hypothetical protein